MAVELVIRRLEILKGPCTQGSNSAFFRSFLLVLVKNLMDKRVVMSSESRIVGKSLFIRCLAICSHENTFFNHEGLSQCTCCNFCLNLSFF